MDIISEDELQTAAIEVAKEKEESIVEISEQFNSTLAKMSDPIDYQKELATNLKLMIDKRIALESEDRGLLSETSRRWLVDYNNVLNTLHKNIHGDKSTNLNVHVVAHSDIASKIRKFNKK